MDIWLHITNIAVHVICGTLAIGIGFFLLATDKGTYNHIRWGKNFAYLGFVVCITSVLGNIFFRFLPLFAILTVLVSYLLVSGWRNIVNKAQGPGLLDAIFTLGGYLGALLLLRILLKGSLQIPAVIIYSSLGATFAILIYDSLRWIFPRPWHARLWRYEHIYKMVSSLFAMVSAFLGNTLRAGQPWSQIIPSAIGIFAIVYLSAKLYRRQKKISESSQ